MNISEWGWPQFIYVSLALVGLGLEISRSGQPKKGNHDLFSSLIATSFIFWLLYSGGFFK